MGVFSRVTRAVKTVGRAVSSVARQGVGLVKEAANRIVGIPVFVLSWAGVQWPMKMRLRVVILRDGNNDLVADPAAVRPSIEEAREIFEREANVRIQPVDHDFILPAPTPAPPDALSVRCGFGLLRDELGTAGRYFRRFTARTASSFFTGYATPLTVFIVDDIAGKSGCALGPSVTYAVVSDEGLESKYDPCGNGSDPGPPGDDDSDGPPIVIEGTEGSSRADLLQEVQGDATRMDREQEEHLQEEQQLRKQRQLLQQQKQQQQAEQQQQQQQQQLKAHRVLAHEIAHMCGLSPELGHGRLDRHSDNCRDLMHNPPGKRLTRRRKAAIIRNSRFVSTL